MYLNRLSLLNFKNYAEGTLDFSPKINCLAGNNGAGKTNILDAIHYLSLTKSYLNVIDSQNIKHDAEMMVIEGYYQNNDSDNMHLYCAVQRGKKKVFKRDKKDYQKLSEHIGLMPCVMISPVDYELILGGSEERRKFINGVIAQYDKQYLLDVMNYNRLLLQRNKMLKDPDAMRANTDMLDVWDEQLAPLGMRVFESRKKFAAQLIPLFQEYYSTISGDNERVELTYQSQLEGNDFLTVLQENRQKDLALQYTNAGIHKDDLVLDLGGYPIKKSGSQGQQKTYLVALKLAKFNFIEKTTGVKPLLLLDDIFDKFDQQRVKHIISLVSQNRFGQIFITDTHLDRLQEIIKTLEAESKYFMVENGQVKAIDYEA